MELSIKELALAVDAISVTGNEDLKAQSIILRSACTAAMKNPVFFDLRIRFKGCTVWVLGFLS